MNCEDCGQQSATPICGECEMCIRLHVALDENARLTRELADAMLIIKDQANRLQPGSNAYQAAIARAEKAEAGWRDLLAQVSASVASGATRHPAYDQAWILTEVNALREQRDEAEAKLREVARLVLTYRGYETATNCRTGIAFASSVYRRMAECRAELDRVILQFATGDAGKGET